MMKYELGCVDVGCDIVRGCCDVAAATCHALVSEKYYESQTSPPK